ncbi:MAG: 4Fe-4S binding protein [Oscillospiraceae bacterium]|nr:4Fe-4S binding protein [Oscillospiraceae bacterium]
MIEWIRQEACIGCGQCVDRCPLDITFEKKARKDGSRVLK